MTALTDEQMAVLEAQAAAGPLTDEQLGSLQTLEQTPFGQKALPPSPPRIPEKGAVPPPAPPEPLTDRQIRDLEEETYRRPDYIMTPEEHGAYWDRRNAENNEVGRFLSGLGGGAAGLLELGNEAGREMVDAATGFFKSPTNYYKRLAQTGAETFRKSGVGLLMLYDWVGNKIDDLSTGAKRGEAVNAQIREQLQAEGKFTGDRTTDEQIYQAALVEARRAGAYDPTPDQQEEDAQTKYDRYVREKTLEMEFAGVTDFQIGTSKMTAPAATKEAYQITDAEPYEAMSMLGSMVADPLNAIPIAGGAAINLRLMRRMATLSGAPLRGIQKGADKLADAAERAEFAVGSRVQNLTGLTPKQQAAAGAGLAGLMATSGQDRNALGQAVMFAGSVMPTLRYGGALVRRVGATAGAGQVIVREAGVGGLGLARAEAAAELAGNAAIPARYGKYFKGYVDGTDSTLKRVSMNSENPEILRRMARLGDNVGLSAVARTADDFVSGAAVGLAVGAPFAALQPDAERAGEMLGAIAPIAGVASVGARAVGRGGVAADADIARMLADVQAVGGDAAGLAALPHATLDRMSAMQGVLSGKVDFVPLRADEYRMNVDMSRGGETPAGMFVDRDGTGRARIFINLDANRAAGAVIPHEIGHAILTSNILDGEPRADLRNLVNQQYGPDGVAARGREYAARIVDSDIANGTTGEPPKVMTEAEFRDLDTGRRTPAEVSRGRKMEPAERDRLIAEKMEELEQRSIENGGDRLDWARDEIIAETFASEAPAIDFRGIRRDAMFPRMAESVLSAGGRVLEMMGVRLDQGTGKLMDNPSVLFRENPLFQDRITQKRVREYVRSYDQYLTGLEEAGAKNLRGVELARSNRPEDLSRSTHVKLRDEGRGVLENDFLFQKPDGTYAFKPQKLINAAEANRAAQIKTLYDARKFVPVNSSEFGKRKINGREVIGGPVLPKQFDLFTQFPQHVREFARAMEASRAEGGSWNIDYNAIGTGSSGRYRITNMGAVRAIQRETVPFGWQVTKQNHLLAASLDLNAFRASAMKAINRGELGVFNNDMRQLETDLKTYLANHRNGLPGEAVIGMAKRDMINGLIGTGTAVQRTANPLYSDLNPKGSIRTWRIDRLNDAQPSGRTGYFFDYDKINNNRMPEAIPRDAQGMPDAPASGRADGMDAQPIFGTPTESDSGGSTWRFGRGDSQLDVSYSKDRNTFYVNAADGEYGPYASAAEAGAALLEVGRDVADRARPAIERDALRDGLTASKRVAGESGVRSVGVSRVKGSTKSDSLYFDVNVELDPKLGKRLYDEGVQDRRDTGSWSWDIDDDAGVIEGARISVRVSDHADVSAFSKSSAAIQDFVTPTKRGDWLQSADRVMQDIEDRLGAPLPRLKIQKPAIADGPLEAVASRLAAVRSKQHPSAPTANVNRQSAAAPRGQAMPDAVGADAPPFYMKSAQVLDSKIQGKAATADQVRAILKNPQNGIKAEELKWTGIEQAVERIAKENGGKVPKEALLRYLQEDGAVRLEEVRLGSDARSFDPPEFAQYQLPGGENYREVVLTMPADFSQSQKRINAITAEMQALQEGSIELYKRAQTDPAARQEYDAKQQRFNALSSERYNLAEKARDGRSGEVYKSSHFPDTPNYVAHIRLNERTDAAGKPGLFLEEIQSDRHQAGREKGYVDAAIRNEQEALLAKQTLSDGDLARIEEIKAMGQGDIPDAPFRKDWPVQMFKRALADAVENGKEWIGWTTGETQARRYDLSKQVDALDYQKNQDGTYRLSFQKDSRGNMIGESIPADKLEEYVGKDVAQKIVEGVGDDVNFAGNNEPQNIFKRLAGLDLKVGGEGMKGFYDQILPKEISKYVKQWGGQVEKARIGQPKKHSGKLTRDELAEAKRDAKALINGDIDVAEFNDNWGTRLTDNDVPGNDPYRLNESATDLVSVVRKERELDAGGTLEAWRVNITPQMRESIKKAGQALFVGGVAAVVADEELR